MMDASDRHPDPVEMQILDPDRDRPGYWKRFQRSVLEAAQEELRRRRALYDASVATVVSSWWRAVVPLAAAACLGAVALILTGDEVETAALDSGPAQIEEYLHDDLDVPSIPAVLESDITTSSVAFMAAIEEGVSR